MASTQHDSRIHPPSMRNTTCFSGPTSSSNDVHGEHKQSSLKTENPNGAKSEGSSGVFSLPSVSLPKGGGAMRGMGDKFDVNQFTGTGRATLPIATSSGRSGFSPKLDLSYDSGSGNGPFGFGWHISLPSVTRKTDKGLPQYEDVKDSDTFIMTGAEDLVPSLELGVGGKWEKSEETSETVGSEEFEIQLYRPRVESEFSRIEKWTNIVTREAHWVSTTKDNVRTTYGRNYSSKIFDPDDPTPQAPRRVFSWLICESRDDKGNVIVYEYQSEDAANVDLHSPNERNRTPAERSVNRHIKRIRYGNKVSVLVEPDISIAQWLFEVVFDYGEHDLESHSSLPAPNKTWICRNDPFSTFRATFEIRTYRLCQRVLMFHHFPDEPDVGADCLVQSTDFTYRSSRGNKDDEIRGNPIASFLTSIQHNGYLPSPAGSGSEYFKESMPPVEYGYSEATITSKIQAIDEASLQNFSSGFGMASYQFIDLDGEGVSGILTGQSNALFYKRNAGNGHFGPLEAIRLQPSVADLEAVHLGQRFMDLEGNGAQNLVQFSPPAPGFTKRINDKDWKPFKPFAELPVVPWTDPNLQFFDLTGNGRTDLLFSETDSLWFYASLGERGFESQKRIWKAHSEESGPNIVFADGTRTVFTGDMTGDGLVDIVRVRNGDVCYWPNLGYGKFGKKVAMGNAPCFDNSDIFDPQRLKMADIDGSGTTDLIYLGAKGVSIYFNQSGNSWSDVRTLAEFPPINSVDDVRVCDLLGNGTSCLVWSSALPHNQRSQMFYVDLMGGKKPHLLTSIKNNLGAETLVEYVSSTKFYLKDKADGKPWATRLPFPVHVVETYTTLDRISRNTFTSKYAYHHGFYDGVEREFRGFGMVEHWDTEQIAALSSDQSLSPLSSNLNSSSNIPPVLTKTWTHTGAYTDAKSLMEQFAREYYIESPNLPTGSIEAMSLPGSVFSGDVLSSDGSRTPYTLLPEESCEATRALKGLQLRQEIFTVDDTETSKIPHVVSEHNYVIEMLQPRGDSNLYSSFYPRPRETVEYKYERALVQVGSLTIGDPRVSHSFILAINGWGNPLQSVSINYGRRDIGATDQLLTQPDRETMRKTRITFTEKAYTNAIDEVPASYRAPVVCEEKSFELIKANISRQVPITGALFRANELQGFIQTVGSGAYDIPFADFKGATATQDHPYRRLIKHSRTFYRRNDLSGPLPLGEIQSLALPYESYSLALTSDLAQNIFGDSGKINADKVNDVFSSQAGYVHSSGDSNWWTPSGQMFYSPGSSDSAQVELAYAQSHFFHPHRLRDPFYTSMINTEVTVTYDDYCLLVQETRDALGNRLTAGERNIDPVQGLARKGQDYRTLSPFLIMDENRNREIVAFDALGHVAGKASMGKPEEEDPKGDNLDEFNVSMTADEVVTYFRDPLQNAKALLLNASARYVYDFFAYHRTKDEITPKPIVVSELLREKHVSDLATGESSRILTGLVYSDGFGRQIQYKHETDAGVVSQNPINNGQPQTSMRQADPRWIASGWKIHDNKGQVVREFEPFFTITSQFEYDFRVGVSPIFFYDPLQRNIGTLHPNHSWSKTLFGAWSTETWDVNDTILISDPAKDLHLGAYFRKLAKDEYSPTWFDQQNGGTPQQQSLAKKTAVHGGTPTREYLDSLGHSIVTIHHNRFPSIGTASGTTEEFYSIRHLLDVEGQLHEVTDAKGRKVMVYNYDMTSQKIHESSMEAGERWFLTDVVGKPSHSWGSRGFGLRTAYDAGRRPTQKWLTRSGSTGEAVVEQVIYGEMAADSLSKNLLGKVFQNQDQAGRMTMAEYDFKGNLVHTQRQVAKNYKDTLDYSNVVALEDTVYGRTTTYDALNRPQRIVNADQSVTVYRFNKCQLLQGIDVKLENSEGFKPYVSNIDYDAKSQRTLIQHGNGVVTTYEYDPLTFRLAHIFTKRPSPRFSGDCPTSPTPGWPGCQIQSLFYTYDPIGNTTNIRDDAQQSIFFDNTRVDPSSDFTYDATYRLILASGREHLGQAGKSIVPTASDSSQIRVQDPRNGNAMGLYEESYTYDSAGNILSVAHKSSNAGLSGWTRKYLYQEPSQLEPAVVSNRLTSTSVGNVTEQYRYNGEGGVHGNMTSMPHLSMMQWDYRDKLQSTSRQVVNSGAPETTWYTYDSFGNRIRKVTERQASEGSPSGSLKSDHLYLDEFEIHRSYEGDGTTVAEKYSSLHIMDDKHRVAIAETRTKGEEPPQKLVRYQYGNSLESVTLELDDLAQIISYEEYLPFGGTSYQTVRSDVENSKRYRFSGKERDDQNGFYFHGSRYYAPWLGRWTSSDPAGLVDGENLFVYVSNRSTVLNDPTGEKGHDTKKTTTQRKSSGGKAQTTKTNSRKTQQQHEKPKAPAKIVGKKYLQNRNNADFKEFEASVGALTDLTPPPSTTEEKTKDYDLFTKDHDEKTMKFINEALRIATKHFTKVDPKTGKKRVTATTLQILGYALTTMIVPMRQRGEAESQNVIFRDGGHWVAGRQQQWQYNNPINDLLKKAGMGKTAPTANTKFASGAIDTVYDWIKEAGNAVAPEGNKGSLIDTSELPAAAPGGRHWSALGADEFSDKDKSSHTPPAMVTHVPWKEVQ